MSAVLRGSYKFIAREGLILLGVITLVVALSWLSNITEGRLAAAELQIEWSLQKAIDSIEGGAELAYYERKYPAAAPLKPGTKIFEPKAADYEQFLIDYLSAQDRYDDYLQLQRRLNDERTKNQELLHQRNRVSQSLSAVCGWLFWPIYPLYWVARFVIWAIRTLRDKRST